MSERDDDTFDARLVAAFRRAEEAYEDNGFSERLVARLGDGRRLDRRRLVILGGAGSVGSAAAGVQVQDLVAHMPMSEGVIGQAVMIVGPETFAAALIAIAIAAAALLLPGRL